jgi:hypothetical protein
MKSLVLCALILAPAFAADDPLPATKVTIHATMSAREAYAAVAKILGVRIIPDAGYVHSADGKPDAAWVETHRNAVEALKAPVTLDLENATGAEALDTIGKVTHRVWTTVKLQQGILVTVTAEDDPPQKVIPPAQ